MCIYIYISIYISISIYLSIYLSINLSIYIYYRLNNLNNTTIIDNGGEFDKKFI